MAVRKQDATRALELLEQYQKRLNTTDDPQLKASLERVIKIFKSKLFNALIEIQETYELTLNDENQAAAGQREAEAAKLAADRWSKPQVAPPSHQPGAAKQKPTRTRQPPAPVDKPQPPPKPQKQKQQQQQPQLPADSFEVELQRNAQGFGFSIAGGTDDPRAADDTSIYVTRIVPGGAAEMDGRLEVEDTILAVNGVDMTAVSHSAAVTRLKMSGNQLRLLVRRDEKKQQQPLQQPPLQQQQQQQPLQQQPLQQQQQQPLQQQPLQQQQQPLQQQHYTEQQFQQQQHGQQQQQYYPEQQEFLEHFEVELVKSGAGLGFSIAGGVDNEHLAGDDSIFITKVIDGGVAQQDGRVQFGDRLLAVDGNSLIGVTHQMAVSALKSTGDVVRLTLQKPSQEELQVLYSTEADEAAWHQQQQQQQHEEPLFPADAAAFQPMPMPKDKKSSKKDKKKHKSGEQQYDDGEANFGGEEQRKSKGAFGGIFGKKKK